MQGIWINGKRPATKKQVKEAVQKTPASVVLEATSYVGREYGGSVSEAPPGSYMFVGPDPYTKRSFYGTIVKYTSGKVVVK